LFGEDLKVAQTFETVSPLKKVFSGNPQTFETVSHLKKLFSGNPWVSSGAKATVTKQLPPPSKLQARVLKGNVTSLPEESPRLAQAQAQSSRMPTFGCGCRC
jgi:hypothetical protein